MSKTYREMIDNFANFVSQQPWTETVQPGVTYSPTYEAIYLSCWKDQLSHQDFASICRVFGAQQGATYAMSTKGEDNNKKLEGEIVWDGVRIELTIYGAFVCTPITYDQPKDHTVELSPEQITDREEAIRKLEAEVNEGSYTFTPPRTILEFDCQPVGLKIEVPA